MVLHTVNKSPFTSAILQECLTVIGTGHSLLLIEDGVYGTLSSNPLAKQIIALASREQVTFFALSDDLSARGLEGDSLLRLIKPIDYNGFVDLVTRHQRIQSWF